MRVSVRRSGGFAGLVRTGTADLPDDDARRLAEAVAAAAGDGGSAVPDAFSYHVEVGGAEWTVGEHDLPGEVHRRLQSILNT